MHITNAHALFQKHLTQSSQAMFPSNSWNYLHARLVTWSQTTKAKTQRDLLASNINKLSHVACQGKMITVPNGKEGIPLKATPNFWTYFFPGNCYAIWFLTENSGIFRKMVRWWMRVGHAQPWDWLVLSAKLKSVRWNQSATVVTRGDKSYRDCFSLKLAGWSSLYALVSVIHLIG